MYRANFTISKRYDSYGREFSTTTILLKEAGMPSENIPDFIKFRTVTSD